MQFLSTQFAEAKAHKRERVSVCILIADVSFAHELSSHVDSAKLDHIRI